MTTIRRSLVLSFIERYALIGLMLISYVLIARLLSPEEIGIYTVAAALIGIVQVLRDFGIGNFLIQVRQLTEAHIRTALGISLLIGGTLYCIAFLAAPWIGQFYGNDRLVGIVRLIALNFLLLPFCSISMSLLKRNMQFGRIMVANISASVSGLVVTIGLAYLGHGPASLAWGTLTTNAVTGVIAWSARADHRLVLPGLSEWRSILNFGGQSAMTGVVTSIAMDANELIVGKVLGFSPVAILSRAQGVMNLFHRDIMSAIRNVAYPAFSSCFREGKDVEERYISSVTAVTAIAWPFYGFMALYALEVLRLMFGPQWDTAAALVPIFCLAGAFAATSNLVLNAVMATGRIDLVTKAELIFQPVRLALLLGAAVVFRSLEACAVAFLCAFILHTPLLYYFKQRCIPNRYRLLFGNLWSSMKVTIAALCIPAAISLSAGFGRAQPLSIPTVGLAGAVCCIAWYAALIYFRHPIASDPLFKRITARLPRIA